MVNLFEHVKPEIDGDNLQIYRDFRATKDPATLEAFKKALATLDAANAMQWANVDESTALTNSTSPSGTNQAAVTATQKPSSGASVLAGQNAAIGVLGAVFSVFALL
jgi:hypothetical protein